MTDVSLLPDITTLQEIVVAGYGAQKRANAVWIAIILYMSPRRQVLQVTHKVLIEMAVGQSTNYRKRDLFLHFHFEQSERFSNCQYHKY